MNTTLTSSKPPPSTSGHSNASSASTLSAVSGAAAPAAAPPPQIGTVPIGAARDLVPSGGLKKAIKRRVEENRKSNGGKEKRAKKVVQRAKQRLASCPKYTLTPLNPNLYDDCTWPVETDQFYREIFVSNYTSLRPFQPGGGAQKISLNRTLSDENPDDSDSIDVVDHENDNAQQRKAPNSRSNVVSGSHRYGGCWKSALNMARKSNSSVLSEPEIPSDSSEDSWNELDFVHDLARDVAKSDDAKLASIVASLAVAVLASIKNARMAFATVENHPRNAILYYNLLMEHAECIRVALSPIAFNYIAGEKLHVALLRQLPIASLATYLEQLRALSCRHERDTIGANATGANAAGAGATAANVNVNHGATLVDCLVPRKEPQAMAREVRIELGSYLARKPLDPAAVQGAMSVEKKLPRSILFLLVPPLPMLAGYQNSFRCHDYIYSLLSELAECKEFRLTNATIHNRSTIREITIAFLLGIKEFVVQVKKEVSDRKIFLVGWDVSALCNMMVAAEVHVSGCISFAHSNLCMQGARGLCDDRLSQSNTPTVFVIGEHSNTTDVDELQDTRDRLPADSGLIVVGGADAQLRVATHRLVEREITQKGVDRMVVSHVVDFILRCVTDSRRSVFLPFAPPREQNDQFIPSDRIHSVTADLRLKPDAAVRMNPAGPTKRRQSSSGKWPSKTGVATRADSTSESAIAHSIDQVIATATETTGQGLLPAQSPAASVLPGASRSRQSSTSQSGKSTSTPGHGGKFAWSGPAPATLGPFHQPPGSQPHSQHGCARHMAYSGRPLNPSRPASTKPRGVITHSPQCAAPTVATAKRPAAATKKESNVASSSTAAAQRHDPPQQNVQQMLGILQYVGLPLAVMLRKAQLTQDHNEQSGGSATAADIGASCTAASPSQEPQPTALEAWQPSPGGKQPVPTVVAASRYVTRRPAHKDRAGSDPAAFAAARKRRAASPKPKSAAAAYQQSRIKAARLQSQRQTIPAPRTPQMAPGSIKTKKAAPHPNPVRIPGAANFASPNGGSARTKGYLPPRRRSADARSEGAVTARVVGVSTEVEAAEALHEAHRPPGWAGARLQRRQSNSLPDAPISVDKSLESGLPATIQLSVPDAAGPTYASEASVHGGPQSLRRAASTSDGSLPLTLSHAHQGAGLAQLQANQHRQAALPFRLPQHEEQQLAAAVLAAGSRRASVHADAGELHRILGTAPQFHPTPEAAGGSCAQTAASPVDLSSGAASRAAEAKRQGRIVYLSRKSNPSPAAVPPRQELPAAAYVMPHNFMARARPLIMNHPPIRHTANLAEPSTQPGTAGVQSSKASVLLIGDKQPQAPAANRRIVMGLPPAGSKTPNAKLDTQGSTDAKSEQKTSPVAAGGLEVEDDD